MYLLICVLSIEVIDLKHSHYFPLFLPPLASNVTDIYSQWLWCHCFRSVFSGGGQCRNEAHRVRSMILLMHCLQCSYCTGKIKQETFSDYHYT